MKVQECGKSEWDEQQHGLDLPYAFTTTDFRISGKGHDRIERIYRTYCDRSACSFDAPKTMPEDRIAVGFVRIAHRSFWSTRLVVRGRSASWTMRMRRLPESFCRAEMMVSVALAGEAASSRTFLAPHAD